MLLQSNSWLRFILAPVCSKSGSTFSSQEFAASNHSATAFFLFHVGLIVLICWQAAGRKVSRFQQKQLLESGGRMPTYDMEGLDASFLTFLQLQCLPYVAGLALQLLSHS